MEGNYTFDLYADFILINDGVAINRTVTIYGNGFTLNGDGSARIFTVSNSNVVFRDIVFVNGASYNGGAISFDYGSICSVENCNFVNNSAKSGGGAIIFEEGTITNCTFINNTAAQNFGGAIKMGSGTIKNCNFTNNAAFEVGGAIDIRSGNIINCNFINNSAQYGGAIYFDEDGTVVSCNFTNNIAFEAGGAIYKGSAKNCNFINNTALKGSAIYNCDYVNCSFVNNFAQFDVKITASPTKVTYKDESYYKITVYGEDGKLADNTQVVIKINGKSFKTLKTNNKGIAKFKVTKTPGTYKLKISALDKTVTKTLTVKHLVTLKSATVKKSAKKLVLTATLGKINGKYLSKKTVTFKFNGKTYNAKTDKKGVAKVTIKSNVIKKLKVGKKVIYQATYLKDAVKKITKVKK